MMLDMKLEALNSLISGLRNSLELSSRAAELDVTPEFNEIHAKIVNALNESFGVSEAKAGEWLMIEDKEEYTRTLDRFIRGEAPYSEPGSGEEGGRIAFEISENPVITAEESEFSGD